MSFAENALRTAQSVSGLPKAAVAIIPQLEALSLIAGVPIVEKSHPLYGRSVAMDDELERTELEAHAAQERHIAKRTASDTKQAVLERFVPALFSTFKTGATEAAKISVLKPIATELKVMLAVGRIAHVMMVKTLSVLVSTATSMIGAVVQFLITNPVGWAVLAGSLLSGGIYYVFKKLSAGQTPTKTGVQTGGEVETPRYRTGLFVGFEQAFYGTEPQRGARVASTMSVFSPVAATTGLMLNPEAVQAPVRREARSERQKRINAEAEALMQKDVFAGVRIEDTDEPFSAKAEIIETMRKEGWDTMDVSSSLNYSKYGINFNKNRSKAFIRNLTPEQAIAIYKAEYWDAAGVDKVPDYLKRVYFNTAVNMGPGTAKKILARSNGTLESFMREKERQYLMICERNPSQYRYLRGWRNRMQAEYNETIQILREHERRQAVYAVAQAQADAKQSAPQLSDTVVIRRGKMLVAVN